MKKPTILLAAAAVLYGPAPGSAQVYEHVSGGIGRTANHYPEQGYGLGIGLARPATGIALHAGAGVSFGFGFGFGANDYGYGYGEGYLYDAYPFALQPLHHCWDYIWFGPFRSCGAYHRHGWYDPRWEPVVFVYSHGWHSPYWRDPWYDPWAYRGWNPYWGHPGYRTVYYDRGLRLRQGVRPVTGRKPVPTLRTPLQGRPPSPCLRERQRPAASGVQGGSPRGSSRPASSGNRWRSAGRRPPWQRCPHRARTEDRASPGAGAAGNRAGGAPGDFGTAANPADPVRRTRGHSGFTRADFPTGHEAGRPRHGLAAAQQPPGGGDAGADAEREAVRRPCDPVTGPRDPAGKPRHAAEGADTARCGSDQARYPLPPQHTHQGPSSPNQDGFKGDQGTLGAVPHTLGTPEGPHRTAAPLASEIVSAEAGGPSPARQLDWHRSRGGSPG